MRKSNLLAAAAFAVALLPLTAAAKSPEIGSAAPAFTLTDISGNTHSLADYKGKFVVLEWINYGCPFVKKHYGTGNMQSTQQKALADGAVWLSICSSAADKEGSMTPAEWQAATAENKSLASAVLLDTDGKVGKSYDAKTTPDMFIIDPSGKLIYKGAIDDKPTVKDEDVKTAKNYVLAALTDAKAGKPVKTSSTESYGCGVKY